jgi:hypothetical protein
VSRLPEQQRGAAVPATRRSGPIRRALAQTGLATVGALQTTAGIAIYIWSGVFVERMVTLAGSYGLSSDDKVAVSWVQLVGAAGFVVMGVITTSVGVIHAWRSARAELKGD